MAYRLVDRVSLSHCQDRRNQISGFCRAQLNWYVRSHELGPFIRCAWHRSPLPSFTDHSEFVSCQRQSGQSTTGPNSKLSYITSKTLSPIYTAYFRFQRDLKKKWSTRTSLPLVFQLCARNIGIWSSQCEAVIASRASNLRICMAHFANQCVNTDLVRMHNQSMGSFNTMIYFNERPIEQPEYLKSQLIIMQCSLKAARCQEVYSFTILKVSTAVMGRAIGRYDDFFICMEIYIKQVTRSSWERMAMNHQSGLPSICQYSIVMCCESAAVPTRQSKNCLFNF